MAERVTATGETTSLFDRKRRAGQRLVIGLQGFAVDDELRALIREIGPAGFILFSRNIAEPEQVLDLTRELRSLSDPATPPLLCVDQEGGRVQRIGAPATLWPSAEELAASGRVEPVAKALGLELRAMGLDLNLAPVADVRRTETHPVIGDRSASTSENEVASYVEAFVRGLASAHVQACLKHFPGHGGASDDSHEHLPTVELDRDELEAVDLRPFRAGIGAGARAVMVGHALYPAWDEHLPASMSPRIQQLLRSGFDGLVLSDDVEMGALQGGFPTDRIASHMAVAEIDLMLCCHTPRVQMEIFETLIRHQESDPAHDRLAEDSARRLLAFREQAFLKRPPRPDLAVVGCRRHQLLRDQVLHRTRGRA